MARSVYKICSCRNHLKCRHPWWFSVKHRGRPQIRKSLDVVLEKHVESKTIAEQEAERLRIGIVDDTLPARTRDLLGLPPSVKPIREALTLAQFLEAYQTRHLARTATARRGGYQIGAITRTDLLRLDGTTAPLGTWLVADVTVDTLERLREVRVTPGLNTRRAKGSNRVGGTVAANRDLRLLRAAFNWGIRTGIVDQTPFKRAGVSAVSMTKERARSRRLQDDEAERLLPACNADLRAIVEAALETGCRKGELLSLQWDQVQLTPRAELWLPAGKTKTGRARRVPISSRLRYVLDMRRTATRTTLELGTDDPLPGSLFVFGNELGERVGAIKTAWRLACARARVEGLHFHDLRREAGSRWMEAGVPLATIQKWLGHTNVAQTSTYLSTTIAGEHEAMRRYEERIGRLIPLDTGAATPPKTTAPNTLATDDSLQQNTVRHDTH